MQGTGFYMVIGLAALLLVGGIALIAAASRLKPETHESRRRYALSRALLIVGIGLLIVGGILACNVVVTLIRIG